MSGASGAGRLRVVRKPRLEEVVLAAQGRAVVLALKVVILVLEDAGGLDNSPNDLPADPNQVLEDDLIEFVVTSGPFGGILREMSPMPGTMGRPKTAHGMTSLLIFREVEPA